MCLYIPPPPSSHAAELDAVVTGVAVLAVQLVVPHSDIGAVHAVAQSHQTHAALEAVDVIEQP